MIFNYLHGRNSNVFHGTIIGNIITGKWIDLPGSAKLADGTLAIRIESDNRLVKLSESGTQSYNVKVWTRNIQAEASAVAGGAAVTASRKDLLEEITVSAVSPQPVASKMILESGKNYIIEVRGTFSCTTGMPACIDAAWCYAPRCARNDPWGELMIDGMSFHTVAGATVPYRDDHVYRIPYPGRGKQAIFGIYDAVVLNSYADNNGALTVRIFQAK
ncbi:MAG: hypothetical protein ACK4TA_07530 [Saprospiraceae bacterium]